MVVTLNQMYNWNQTFLNNPIICAIYRSAWWPGSSPSWPLSIQKVVMSSSSPMTSHSRSDLSVRRKINSLRYIVICLSLVDQVFDHAEMIRCCHNTGPKTQTRTKPSKLPAWNCGTVYHLASDHWTLVRHSKTTLTPTCSQWLFNCFVFSLPDVAERHDLDGMAQYKSGYYYYYYYFYYSQLSNILESLMTYFLQTWFCLKTILIGF